MLHRHVNPRFTNKSKIGLPLGLALPTILLYWHNVNIEKKITGKPSYPIEMKTCISDFPVYMFGVERKCDIPEVSWITSDLQLKSILDLPSSTIQAGIVHVSLKEDVQCLVSLQSISVILDNAINLSKVATYMNNQSDRSPVFN